MIYFYQIYHFISFQNVVWKEVFNCVPMVILLTKNCFRCYIYIYTYKILKTAELIDIFEMLHLLFLCDQNELIRYNCKTSLLKIKWNYVNYNILLVNFKIII